MGMLIDKDLVVDGKSLIAAAEWDAELKTKQEQLSELLRRAGLNAILLKRFENVSWLTGGAVEMRVAIPAETGVGSVLVTVAGKRYYLSTLNEAPRQKAEEFNGLDFEPVHWPWYEDHTVEQSQRLGGEKIGSDTPIEGFQLVNLFPLRAALQHTEITRFRWVSQQAAQATIEVLRQVEPGETEYEMEAATAAALHKRGMLPSVLLMGADERILKFKHAVARGALVKKYAMVNLCARKWGLEVSITRFVHFGPVPGELQRRFEASAQVNAALFDATRVGATSGELFEVARKAYVAQGFPGEEQKHHQGGPAGYWEREWVAMPGGRETVGNNQAFAWNPSIQGGKVEDTMLLSDGKIDVLTAPPDLPVLAASANGHSYPTSGVLEK